MVCFSMVFAPALAANGSFLKVLAMDAAFGKKEGTGVHVHASCRHGLGRRDHPSCLETVLRQRKQELLVFISDLCESPLSLLNQQRFTVISDAQKGMAKIVQEIVPN